MTDEPGFDDVMAGPHACPGGSCGRVSIGPELLLCNQCWRLLPTPARRRVNVAYGACKKDPSAENLAWLRRAQRAAIEAVRAAPAPSATPAPG